MTAGSNTTLQRASCIVSALAIAATFITAHPASARTRSATVAPAPAFSPAVVVSGLNAAEPGIHVAPDGRIYIDAPIGLPNASPVFRSDDHGAHWRETPLGNRGSSAGGGDTNIAIAPDNSLYLTDLWGGESTVSTSEDRGQTWTSTLVTAIPLEDRQWIATTGNGVVYQSYHQLLAGMVVSKSTDAGGTFLSHSIAIPITSSDSCECPPGPLIARRNGSVDDVGFPIDVSGGLILFARSIDSGATFAIKTISKGSSGITSGYAFPVVSDAGSGHLVATWEETSGSATHVMLATSPDWGTTWSAPKIIVSSGTSLYPWVAARGSKIAVTLYHSDTAGLPDSLPAAATWREEYLESMNGGKTFSTLVTVDKTVAKKGPICTNGTACTSNRELLDFQSVTLDAIGNALATWTRSIDNVADTEIRFAKES